MKNLKILLVAYALLYTAPALASDITLNMEYSINSNRTHNIPSEERRLLDRHQGGSDEYEVNKMHSPPSRTCWQVSKPYVIIGGSIFLMGGTVIGAIIGWSEACLSLLAHNGTSILCANNSTNNTDSWTPIWGGIP